MKQEYTIELVEEYRHHIFAIPIFRVYEFGYFAYIIDYLVERICIILDGRDNLIIFFKFILTNLNKVYASIKTFFYNV